MRIKARIKARTQIAENKLRMAKQRCESNHTLITKMETPDASPIAKVEAADRTPFVTATCM
jgi:hypothetical protein